MPVEPRAAATRRARAAGAGQVVAMVFIGLGALVFAPLAIPLIIWIRLRDRRAAANRIRIRADDPDHPGPRR